MALGSLLSVASCDSAKQNAENPLFAEWDTPFGVPPFDKIRTEHYLPAFERGMSLELAAVDAIVANPDEPTFENVILAYDRAGGELMRFANIFDMLSSSDNTPEMQALQEEIMPRWAAHSDRIALNEALFAKVKAVYDKRGGLDLDAEQLRLLEKVYTGFVRAGALLDPEQKERLKAINEELSLVSVKFGNNLLAENNSFVLELGSSQLDGLPAGVRDAAREKAEAMGRKGKYVFTLHKPSWIPFLTYSTDRALREQLYKGYLERGNNGDANDNKQLINDFVRLRTEKAHLLGYPSYAAYVTADEMAGTPQAVYALLDEIWTPALARARGELAEMDELFQQDHPGETFASWDWWYYAEKLRKKNYDLDEEMLRPYFSLQNAQNGIFFLANRLYGITFRPINVPLYNPEATAYEVIDADGERVAPVVAIVCNFTRPTADMPALLTLDEVETLFHEFGHALHFLFHDVKYAGLSSVEGDFVELPSQIMENWALEPEMLAKYATHYRTKEVIPSTLVDKLLRSQHFNQGFMTTELTAAALSDMDIHSTREYKPLDVREYEKSILNDKRGLISQIEPRYRVPYFSHIFDGGYSAGYYFYLWAEVLDKDAFQAFKESGYLFDRETAARFRTLLSSGGSLDGGTLYRNFRGKDPDQRAMLEARGLAEPETMPEEE